MIYSEAVLHHFKNPQNVGCFSVTESSVGRAFLEVAKYHQIMQLQIQVMNGVIQQARFKAYGCGVTIAVGSWTSAWLCGREIQEAYEIHNSDIMHALEIPPVKIHCAVLAQNAAHCAIDDYVLHNSAAKSLR